MDNSQDERLTRIALGLGSNIDPEHNMPQAVALLRQALQVEAVSLAYQTHAVGSPGPDYLNAALLAHTQLNVQQVKTRVSRPIERRLGRVRSANRYAPRTIDVDVLVYGDQVLDPQIWVQAFLAVPLADVLPELRHPQNGETLAERARALQQKTPVLARPEVLLSG